MSRRELFCQLCPGFPLKWRALGNKIAFVWCGWSGPWTENRSTGKAVTACVSPRVQHWPWSQTSSLNVTQLARDAWTNDLACFLQKLFEIFSPKPEQGYKLGLFIGPHATNPLSPKTSSSFVPYTDPGNIIFTWRLLCFSFSPIVSHRHIPLFHLPNWISLFWPLLMQWSLTHWLGSHPSASFFSPSAVITAHTCISLSKQDKSCLTAIAAMLWRT